MPQIVAVQSAGDHPPLFLSHGVDGQNSYAAALSAVLGASRPVHALHETAIDPAAGAGRDMIAIARRWADAIRSVQPRGPYHLAGHSWGARLAFEIAQRLRAAGEEVAFLGILDGRPRLEQRYFGIAGKEPVDGTPQHRNRWALLRHTPSLYDSRITYFRAAEEVAIHRSAPGGGWDFLAPDLRIVDIPGDHLSVIERSGVDRWGPLFADALNRAELRHAPGAADPAHAQVLDAAEACKRGELRTEIALYQAAIARDPALPYWVSANLAEALFQDQQVDAAIGAYRRALDADPWPLTTLVRFAPILKRHRLKSLLRQGAALAAPIAADHGSTALQKARILWLAGRHADGERAFEDGLRASPRHLQLLVAYASFLAARGRRAEAVALLREAADVHPERSVTRGLLERRIAKLRAGKAETEHRRPHWFGSLLRFR